MTVKWRKVWDSKGSTVWESEIPDKDRKAMMEASRKGKSILSRIPWWYWLFGK